MPIGGNATQFQQLDCSKVALAHDCQAAWVQAMCICHMACNGSRLSICLCAGNGYLSYGELWTAIQRAPVLGQARRDMRRIAGLARTPAEKDDALRRAHTHKRTFSLKRDDEFSELVLGHAHSSFY